MRNLNRQPVGKVAGCGGVVSVPRVWCGVNLPSYRCEECGAEVDLTVHLPVLPMKSVPER